MPAAPWQREAAKMRMGKIFYLACSKCGAQPGEFCRSKGGRELTTLAMTHNARITPGRQSKSYRAFAWRDWTRAK